MVNSIKKGKAFERTVVNLFKAAGVNARRTQQFAGNTGDASDVLLIDFPHIHVECKAYHRITKANLLSFYEQCERDTAQNKKKWVVIYKSDGQPLKIMSLYPYDTKLSELEQLGDLVEIFTPKKLVTLVCYPFETYLKLYSISK